MCATVPELDEMKKIQEQATLSAPSFVELPGLSHILFYNLMSVKQKMPVSGIVVGKNE